MKSSTRSIHNRIALVAVALASLPMALACATTGGSPALVARPTGSQQVIYEEGAEKVISMQPGSIVSVRLTKPSAGPGTVVVGVSNQSQTAVVIAPEMVAVSQLGKSVRVFSYEEAEGRERRARESERLTKAILGGLSSSMSSFAPVGASAAYMPGLQSGLQAAQQGMSTSVSNRDINLKELASTSLKKNTLFPGNMGGGVVHTEKIGTGPLTIQVRVGTDIHAFHFSL